jgi:hypothetical protein
VTLYLIVQLTGILKCIFGLYLVEKGFWLNNMVTAKEIAV